MTDIKSDTRIWICNKCRTSKEINEKIRMARKEHKCRWQISPNCIKIIKRGDKYLPLRIPKSCMEYGDGVCMACLALNKDGEGRAITKGGERIK